MYACTNAIQILFLNELKKSRDTLPLNNPKKLAHIMLRYRLLENGRITNYVTILIKIQDEVNYESFFCSSF